MRTYFVLILALIPALILVSCGRHPVLSPDQLDGGALDDASTLETSLPPAEDGGDDGESAGDGQASDGTILPDAAAADLPDLTVPTFKATVKANEATYIIQVCNNGATAAGPFAVHLYYHQFTPPQINQPGDQSETAEGLEAGDCLDLQLKRVGTPSGDAASWVLVDAKGEVQESNEQNNVGGPIKVTVMSPPGPDLIVNKLSAKLTGADIVYDLEVCNIGQKGALLFRVDLYYKRYFAPSAMMLGDTDFYLLTLGPGACKQLSHTYKNAPVGTYNSYALADSLNTVKEINEGNNVAGPTSVTISVPAECIGLCVFATSCGVFGLLDALQCLTWCNGMDATQRQCATTASQSGSCSDLQTCQLPAKPPPPAPPWVCYDICDYAINSCNLLPANQLLTCIGGCLMTLPESKRQCAMEAMDKQQCVQMGLCLL